MSKKKESIVWLPDYQIWRTPSNPKGQKKNQNMQKTNSGDRKTKTLKQANNAKRLPGFWLDIIDLCDCSHR